MGQLIKHIENSDIFLLDFFNKSIKCKPLDWFMPKVTYLGSTAFCIGLCILTFLYPNPYIHLFSIKLMITLFTSTSIAWAIKLSFSRIRPYLRIENLNIKKISIDRYSFPSAHSSAAFSMAVMASMFFPVLSILLMFLAFSVALSRMYIGVHYPTDVLAGIFLGIISSVLIYYV